MKKIAFSMVLFMMISIPVFAEAFNFDQYDDASIIALHNQIQQEMADRKIEKSALLQEGRYKVGEDIPSGTYIVTMKYEKDSWWGNIFVFADDTEKSKKLFNETVFSSDEPGDGKNEGTWKITLEEGNILECTYPITLTIFAGVQFN